MGSPDFRHSWIQKLEECYQGLVFPSALFSTELTFLLFRPFSLRGRGSMASSSSRLISSNPWKGGQASSAEVQKCFLLSLNWVICLSLSQSLWLDGCDAGWAGPDPESHELSWSQSCNQLGLSHVVGEWEWEKMWGTVTRIKVNVCQAGKSWHVLYAEYFPFALQIHSPPCSMSLGV